MRPRDLAIFAMLVAHAASAAACDGTTPSASPDGGSSRDAALDDAATREDGAPTSDGGAPATDGQASPPWSPACPDAQPVAGDPCTQQGLQCEYGPCTESAVVVCQGGVWSQPGFESMPTCLAPDASANPPSCPAAYPASAGTCDLDAGPCTYAQGLCTCVGAPVFGEPPPPGPPAWLCLPGTGSCPFPRARIGTACAQPAQCVYASCSYEQNCTGGVWQGEGFDCPN